MFYALYAEYENEAPLVIGEGTTVARVLDSIKGMVSDGKEVIIVQRIKVVQPTTETVWKEVKS